MSPKSTPRSNGAGEEQAPNPETIEEQRARSGTLWTDVDYAKRGYGRLGVRLPLQVLDQLDELAGASGLSRTEELSQMIDNAWRKWWRTRPR